jgi:hypothetical protein
LAYEIGAEIELNMEALDVTDDPSTQHRNVIVELTTVRIVRIVWLIKKFAIFIRAAYPQTFF